MQFALSRSRVGVDLACRFFIIVQSLSMVEGAVGLRSCSGPSGSQLRRSERPEVLLPSLARAPWFGYHDETVTLKENTSKVKLLMSCTLVDKLRKSCGRGGSQLVKLRTASMERLRGWPRWKIWFDFGEEADEKRKVQAA